MDPQLRAMLQQTVTIAPLTGRDGNAKPTYGSGTDYAARVVGRQQKVKDSQGREVMSRTVAWIDTLGTVIDAENRITLPAAFMPATGYPPILAIEAPSDELGDVDHCKVYFG